MSVLPPAVSRGFIAQLGIDPQRDPGEYDRLQRELDAWWAEGFSCRAWVEIHRGDVGDPAAYGLGPGRPPMTTRDAYRQLVARMRCP